MKRIPRFLAQPVGTQTRIIYIYIHFGRERGGVIHEAFAESMHQAVQPYPSDRASGVKQKHATSVAQKQDITVVLDKIRPSATFGDRVNSQIASRDVREQLALRKHYLFDVSTGKELTEQ